MNWKDTVIKEKQLNKVTSPYITSDRFGLRTKMLEAQAKLTWSIAEKAGKHEGFIEGHKVGRREGIDEGIQRAELFMQRNLPINVDLNPKWQAFLKEVEK